MSTTFALRSKNILIPTGFVDGYVIVNGNKIVDVIPKDKVGDNSLSGGEGWGGVSDSGNSFIMPGIIDPHVHINEPGRTEWEGFDTATKAAAAGGITTMIEMPLNASPVTTTKNNFGIKLNAAKNKLHVNCGFWGGVVPDNLNELEELLDSGVFGLKAFLTHSGIDDFPNTNAEHLRKALKILKKHNKPLSVHCELVFVQMFQAVQDADSQFHRHFYGRRFAAIGFEPIV